MGRGASYGSETTEFVTKRMCLIFVLSISFLCLLAGFIIGRFVSDQILAMNDAHTLQNLDANGLAKTLKYRDRLQQLLNASSFHDDPLMIPEMRTLKNQEVNRTKDLFADFSLFKLNADDIENCTIATICGTEEQDRYIVLSASEHGYDIAYKLAKAFDGLYRDGTLLWQPKRSIMFCVYLGTEDSCMDFILDRIKPKIAAYIAIHGKAALGRNKIAVSGSGMVQATMLDAVDEVKSYNGYDLTVVNSLQGLDIDIPHVILSYVNENGSNQYSSENQKTLAQIAGITMFRLSEGVFLKWNPKYFSDIMNKTLDDVGTIPDLQASNDNLTETVNNLIKDIEVFNSILDRTNMLKPLDVRMMNDKLIDLDRALLCHPPPLSRSKIDFSIFNKLSSIDHTLIRNELKDIENCYKAANRIILDQAQCRQLIKDDSDLLTHN